MNVLMKAAKRLRRAATRRRVELYHCDCIEGLSALEEASVDVVVTSPPYNLGTRYNNYTDDQKREAFLAWCTRWAEQIRRVMKEDGSFFVNVGASPSNPMLPHELVEAMTQDLFLLQNTIHWVKSIAVEIEGNEITFGHFKPISSDRFLNDCHEYIFHFTKTGRVNIDRLAVGVPYTDKSNIRRWKHTGGADVRCRGNTWFIPYETIRSREKERPHPATFPPELAINCIRLHGIRRGMVIVDPFVGIGSSGVAADRCGVSRFIGFDIDQTYLAVASERLGVEVTTLAEMRSK